MEYDSRNSLMDLFANEICTELRELLKVKDKVTIAVPGGSTPKPFFERLSKKDLNWSRIVVIPTDERFVPENNVLSNAGLIRNNLLINKAKNADFISFFRPNHSPERLPILISTELKNVLPLDICVLGMGVDMHTASIFPGGDRLTDALDLNTTQVLIPMTSPNVREKRFTLTARILTEASKIHFLITGSDKKTALNIALQSKDCWELAPIRSVLYCHNDVRIHYAQ